VSAARLAATVIVLRPTLAAPEILMVRRSRGASFMADAFVFPGGRVDETDRADGELGAFRAAAVRELREEAEVIVDPSSLVPLSRWITPSAEPKRFDTCFFVVAVPSGTSARVDAAEVTEVLWAPAVDVLARHASGALKLPPPTLRTLADLAPFCSIDDIVSWAKSRPLAPIQPKLIPGGDGSEILMPWHPDYAGAPGEGIAIEPTSPLADGPPRYLGRDGRYYAA
jgi:8-oxo-dGTP pyrophosphatase MutT (NUDIX family)